LINNSSKLYQKLKFDVIKVYSIIDSIFAMMQS